MNSTIYGILGQQPWMNLIIYLLLFMIILLLFPKNIFIYKFLLELESFLVPHCTNRLGVPRNIKTVARDDLKVIFFIFY